MTAKLTASLREAPATAPALAAAGLFALWATDQAGYPLTHWAPGGLIVLALLGMAAGLVGVRLGELALAVRVALGSFVLYTALSFLSILWAAVPGDAWEGADRTLLYLMVFALFACWRQTSRTAALLLVAWTIALIGVALFSAAHLEAASSAGLASLLPGGRLVYPSGYANANAAQWLMAFWPCLLLAAGRRLPSALRGFLAGGAVLLAGLALLSQSRGSVYATAAMLVLVFALLPGRVRNFAVLVPVGAGVAAAAAQLLRADELLADGQAARGALHRGLLVLLIAALAVGVVVGIGAALESRGWLSPAIRRRIALGLRVSSLAALLAVIALGLVLAGNPVSRVSRAWESFKGGYGANSSGGTRLLSGLGSNRYDFYRVALDEFLAHPILGIGADNFQEPYLRHGRSDETPRYPHSVEFRVLSQSGLLGAALALLGLGGALLAGGWALRRADPLASTVVAASLAGFAYWMVHGSLDWFWEFAGLGAPAFAMLGLVCALMPARTLVRAPGAQQKLRADGARRTGPALAGALLGGLAAIVALGLPWLSQMELQSAAGIWTRAPGVAYARLRDAARLNPLSDQAYLLAGSIALRYGDLRRADHEFALALGRSRDDPYATLERGAIAAQRGERAAALALLGRAARLDPRGGVAERALGLVRAGRPVNVEELNRSILDAARQLA